MTRPAFALLVLAGSSFAPAQYVEQHTEPATGTVVLTETIAIPVQPAGYTLILPETKRADGLIVFFQADRDTTNKLFRDALPEGLGVLFVTTENRLDFFFEDSSMERIEEYISDVIHRYEIPPRNLMYAGMSLAGTRAARFTLFSASDASQHHLVPFALALCDSPLDFTRFWREMDKARRVKATSVTENEGEWVTGYLERNLGGTPSDVPEAYRRYSPYAHDEPDSGKLAVFAAIHVRTYTEPDVLWWMETRKKDYYAMNAIDMAAFVNDLTIAGSGTAELFTTENKGYHPDGTRHPHSWSIVDEAELVQWFRQALAAE